MFFFVEFFFSVSVSNKIRKERYKKTSRKCADVFKKIRSSRLPDEVRKRSEKQNSEIAVLSSFYFMAAYGIATIYKLFW